MSNIPFVLGQLTDADVDWLARVGERREVPVGTLLVEKNLPVEWIFILLQGRFSLYGAAGSGVIGAGEMIGEISFIDSIPPSADVVASEDSVVLAVPHTALRERLLSEPEFAVRFYRAAAMMLAERLRDAAAVASGMPRPPEEIAGDGLGAVTAWQRFERLVDLVAGERGQPS
jgi:CRP/FNR family transcriptional regulator, cyclic AMP receptor protein